MQVTKVVWDNASGTLAVASLDDTCSLWQRTDANWRRSMLLRSKAGRFTCMRFLPAEHALITGASPQPLLLAPSLRVHARLISSEKGLAKHGVLTCRVSRRYAAEVEHHDWGSYCWCAG